jgi:hypothetical protein
MADDVLSQADQAVVEPAADIPPHVRAVGRFDAAMQPFLSRLSGIGAVTEHQLAGAITAIRHGLAAALGPDVEDVPATGESLDMVGVQREADRRGMTTDEVLAERNAAADASLADEPEGVRMAIEDPAPVNPKPNLFAPQPMAAREPAEAVA